VKTDVINAENIKQLCIGIVIKNEIILILPRFLTNNNFRPNEIVDRVCLFETESNIECKLI
jgi:hypothetical protein